jgi:mesencephalic astrocyte-derived neurotrophic factor
MLFIAVILALFALSFPCDAKVTVDNCEVCVKFINRLIDQMGSTDLSDEKKVEKTFKSMCSKAKDRDERFCYYIGGLETSATYIVNELTKPVSWGMPADKVCERLKSKDSQICDLRYDKAIDLKAVNFNKLKVKDLRKILEMWGEECKGCSEKSEFIRLVKDKMAIHDPEAYKARKDEL